MGLWVPWVSRVSRDWVGGMTDREWRERPRCPRCGARAWLVVARRPDGVYVSGGPLVVTVGCGYSVRGAGRCRQPVALVLDGPRAEYAFPPTFEAIDGLTAEEIITRYGPGAVWARKGRS